MRNIISFMHVSLDGFVAGPHGEMNWIQLDQEIFDHIGKRIAATDSALYGRVTYEMMQNYWPGAGEKPGASKHDIEHSRWYAQAHKIVLSGTMNQEGLDNTTIMNGNLPERINDIKQAAGGSEEILLFGSPTATHSLMELDLLDGYWLFVNPVILGRGIRLFEGVKERTKLKLLTSRVFGKGVTELSYMVERG